MFPYLYITIAKTLRKRYEKMQVTEMAEKVETVGSEGRFRKIVELTKEQMREVKKWAKQYTTDLDAAEAAGLKERTYGRIKELGRGNSVNVGKLLAVVMPAAEPAEEK